MQVEDIDGIQLIESLKKDVEKVMGAPLASPKDFIRLSEAIYKQIHVQLSSTTLKRIWGYLDEAVVPRISTLNILAQFLGYNSLTSYQENLKMPMDNQSQMIIQRMLVASQIPAFAQITLTWAPGRVCQIRHEGKGVFQVICSEKTKLLPGDTFECQLFIEQEPLFIYNLKHNGRIFPAYVAGKKEGIHFQYKGSLLTCEAK